MNNFFGAAKVVKPLGFYKEYGAKKVLSVTLLRVEFF